MDDFSGFILIVIIIVAVSYYAKGKSNNIKRLKRNYDYALQGTNRKEALEAGREYYSALRGGKTLTIYDEQAIANDLSTMTS